MNDVSDVAEEAEDAALGLAALEEYRREGGVSAATFFEREASAKGEDEPSLNPST